MNRDVLYPLRCLHGAWHEHKAECDLKKHFVKEFRTKAKKNPHTVFLVMTPEHGNLGDHAIAQAEIELLQKAGIDYVEITDAQLAKLNRLNALSLMNGSPIMITGGGNMGTLWPNVELMQQRIVQQNPKSQICILPNTIFYEDSDWGRQEFEKSALVYNSHANLCVYARESSSYEVMTKAYSTVKLIPDMVLSLHPELEIKKRQGCLLCLRSDKEKTRTPEQENHLREQARTLFGDAVKDVDMIVEGTILPNQREQALQKQFELFTGAKLVITDRLHGMIFCAVTGTPCIVVNSKSPKVRGCYEWIKNLDYICFADDGTPIADLYRAIPYTAHKYDNTHLVKYYQELTEDILNLCRRS